MKYNFFNDTQVFAQLEDKAINGQLNYDDFPSEEYKYFSKLTKLGYYNRHKGWSIDICEAKQKEFKQQYNFEKDKSNCFFNLSTQMQKNIIKSSEAVRNMYKSESEHEMFLHALEALELATGENGLKKRLSDVEETNK